MLFKNLIFSTLLASKVLAEPLHITIDIDLDNHNLRPVHSLDEYPYEPINADLEYQKVLVSNATEAVQELDFAAILATLRKYQSSVLYQSKRVPDTDLSEGDTAFVEPVFEETTIKMSDLYTSIEESVDSLKKLDSKGQLYKQLTNDRNSWFLYFNAIRTHLYKCDEDEKKGGCVGQTPFNRLNTEVTTYMLKVQNQFKSAKSIEVQYDL